jgi:T5SS/PEP-CTERM-associated repeat protein
MTTYYMHTNDYTDGGGTLHTGGRLDDENTYYYHDPNLTPPFNVVHGIPGGGDTVIYGTDDGTGVGIRDLTGSISGVGTWTGGYFANGASLGAHTVYDVSLGPGGSVTADDFADNAASDGGTLSAQTVHGTLTVSGDTSDVTVANLTNKDGDDSTWLNVSGGKVAVTNVQTGASVHAGATISGGTTTITNFAIGSKQAAIIVEDTGSLTVTTMAFGQNSGDFTHVTVDGSDAMFKYSTGTPIGNAGHGEISLSTAARLNVGKAVLGKSSGGEGDLEAADGSHFDIASLVLGVAGYGSFHLSTAATAKVSGNLTVGQGATGYGIFGVSGSGSHLTVTGKTLINNENGSSTVSESGKFDTGSLTIAGRAGTNLGLNISGDGSALTVKGAIVIGQAGSGTLAVTDHAQFAAAGQKIDLGKKAGAHGMLTLTDAAKNIGASDLTIGDAGNGTVTLIRGAEQIFRSITLGAKDDGSGQLTVGTASATAGDPASKLHVTGDLIAGVAGIGGASIYGIATIDGGATMGDLDGGTGYMTVQGKGAAATVKDTISLGGQIVGGKVGDGHLSVYGGAHVTTGKDAGVIGYTAGSSTAVIGQGSKLTTDVLAMFNGTLTVQDQGVIDVQELAIGSLTEDAQGLSKVIKFFWDPIFALIGEDLGADGKDVAGGQVVISGSGTKVEAETIRLAAASRTKSTYGFTVADGAMVSATPSNAKDIAFALDGGSAGIDGAKSSLAVHGQATLGLAGAGNGDLYVSNHAKMTIDQSLALTSDSSLPALELASILRVNSGGSVEVGGSGKAAANTILVDAGHKISGSGVLSASKIVVSGQIEAKRIVNNGSPGSDELELSGAVQGPGKLIVDPHATLTLGGTDHEVEVAFKGNGGTLVLNQPTGFTAALLQLSPGDRIELQGVQITRAPLDVNSSELDLYTRQSSKPAFTFAVQGLLAGNHIDVENDGRNTLLTVVGGNAEGRHAPNAAEAPGLAGTSRHHGVSETGRHELAIGADGDLASAASASDHFVFQSTGDHRAAGSISEALHSLQGAYRIGLHPITASTDGAGDQDFTLAGRHALDDHAGDASVETGASGIYIPAGRDAGYKTDLAIHLHDMAQMDAADFSL